MLHGFGSVALCVALCGGLLGCDTVAAFVGLDASARRDAPDAEHPLDATLDADAAVRDASDLPRTPDIPVPDDLNQPPSDGAMTSVCAMAKSSFTGTPINNESFDLALDQAGRPRVVYDTSTVLYVWRGDPTGWTNAPSQLIANRLAAAVDASNTLHILYAEPGKAPQYMQRSLNTLVWTAPRPASSTMVTTYSVALAVEPGSNTVYGVTAGANSTGPLIARFSVLATGSALARCSEEAAATPSLRFDTVASAGYVVETWMTDPNNSSVKAYAVGNRCTNPITTTLSQAIRSPDAIAFEDGTRRAYLAHVVASNTIVQRRIDIASPGASVYVPIAGPVNVEPSVIAAAYDTDSSSINLVYHNADKGQLEWIQSRNSGLTWSTPTVVTQTTALGGRVRAIARGGVLHVLSFDSTGLRYSCVSL